MKEYLHRCFELARQSPPSVAPNPPVGALVVKGGRIIGEGFHERFGGPHAEIVALDRVQNPAERVDATLFVSLEPCNHTGKTPPCTERIIRDGIAHVVVGCMDPNPIVAGKGIAALRQAGIDVQMAPDAKPFENLIRFFTLNQKRKRPYVLLKWAETADGKIGRSRGNRLQISGPDAIHYVHGLRSEYQAIMVGKNTVRKDNPLLSVRHQSGPSPVRILFDIDLDLSPDLAVFRPDAQVIVINHTRDETAGHIRYFVPQNKSAYLKLDILLGELYERCGIGSILVEGGRYLLQQFLNQDIYDEIQLLRNPRPAPSDADVSAPWVVHEFRFDRILPLGSDMLFVKNNLYPNH